MPSSLGLPSPSSLEELIDVAERENWCTKPFCTTCGSVSFRAELGKIKREEVIAGLRLLTAEFIAEHSGTFRLIIRDTAYFGFGSDLLGPLEGTPAGNRLNLDIERQERREDDRRRYLDSQTPEAIVKRRVEIRAERKEATAPHRDRKLASQETMREARILLDSTPDKDVLTLLDGKGLGAPMLAIGGFLYERLRKHYRGIPMEPSQREILKKLADLHLGHWKQLFDKTS